MTILKLLVLKCIVTFLFGDKIANDVRQVTRLAFHVIPEQKNAITITFNPEIRINFGC